MAHITHGADSGGETLLQVPSGSEAWMCDEKHDPPLELRSSKVSGALPNSRTVEHVGTGPVRDKARTEDTLGKTIHHN